MKRILLFGIAASLIFGVACDKEENAIETNFDFDYALFPGEKEDYLAPEFSEQYPYNHKRVLLEDYTGHTCGNCPGAAKVAKELVEKYGKDFIVPVAVHSSAGADAPSSFQAPRPPSFGKYQREFLFPEALEYGNFFNVFSNPLGMINRVKDGAGVYVFGKSTWENLIQTELSKELEANLQIVLRYYEETRGLFVHIEAKPEVDDVRENLGLITWLVEDTIIDWQLNYQSSGGDPDLPDGDIEDYVHEHTLVGTISGAWGEDVGTPFYEENAQEFAYSQVIDHKHSGEMQVVAMIYDKNTHEILQVANEHFHVAHKESDEE